MLGGKAGSTRQTILGSRAKITLDKSLGKKTLTLETPHGQTIPLSETPDVVRVTDAQKSCFRSARRA